MAIYRIGRNIEPACNSQLEGLELQHQRQCLMLAKTNSQEAKGNHFGLVEFAHFWATGDLGGALSNSFMPTTWPYPRDIYVGPWKSISDLYIVLLFALLFLMRKKKKKVMILWANSLLLKKWANRAKWWSISNIPQSTGGITLLCPACGPVPSQSLIPPPRPQRVKPANCPAVLLGQHEGWLPLRGQSDSANLMCCHQGPSRRRAPWWFRDANSRIAKWFSSPAASASICCWAEAQPAACLSQHVLKLAGEEALSCANYILIIGNVLANQALIAISESVSSSRVKGLSALAGACWAQFFHRR